MRRALWIGGLALLLVIVTAASAIATPLINPETGKNIYAWQKPHTIWNVHLTGTASSAQGEVLILETACHDGVGVKIVAPSIKEPTGGLITVETDDGDYEIPIEDYQAAAGFLFVLDHWPSTWPVERVYLDPITPSLPLFVEWETLYVPGELEPSEVFEALADGRVTIELYDAGGEVLSGTTD